MRRLARHLFTLCSAVSLLFCVTACVLWARSYVAWDKVTIHAEPSHHILVSGRGRFDYMFIGGDPDKGRGMRLDWVSDPPRDVATLSPRRRTLAGMLGFHVSLRGKMQWDPQRVGRIRHIAGTWGVVAAGCGTLPIGWAWQMWRGRRRPRPRGDGHTLVVRVPPCSCVAEPVGGHVERGAFAEGGDVLPVAVMRGTLIGVAVVLALTAAGCAARRHEPGRRAAELAGRGLELYSARQFAASHAGGQYTDPDPASRAREFWSDGSVAKVDAEGDGHYETIYLVREGHLDYVGRLGRGSGRFVATGRAYRHLAGLTLVEAGLGGRRTQTPSPATREAQ